MPLYRKHYIATFMGRFSVDVDCDLSEVDQKADAMVKNMPPSTDDFDDLIPLYTDDDDMKIEEVKPAIKLFTSAGPDMVGSSLPSLGRPFSYEKEYYDETCSSLFITGTDDLGRPSVKKKSGLWDKFTLWIKRIMK
jgi:hypothetical protein